MSLIFEVRKNKIWHISWHWKRWLTLYNHVQSFEAINHIPINTIHEKNLRAMRNGDYMMQFYAGGAGPMLDEVSLYAGGGWLNGKCLGAGLVRNNM
jgi:hypothetical protein